MQAIKLILTHKKASVSMLQRRLKIGFARAGRVMDMVEEAGMVPAFKSVKLLPPGDFSRALVEANARGGNYNWYFGQNPDGFNQNTLGPIFELLATDGDVEAFVNDVTAAFQGIAK